MDVHNQNPTHDMSNFKQAQVVVIMVPFPCQSHLNQLLQLSCLISSYNIPVHYACSATHTRQTKLRFTNTNRFDNTKIHFHEFPNPPFLSPPPNPNASIKFPVHLQVFFDASLHLREPMAALLHEISTTARRVIVIHDVLMAYVVQDIATLPNAESYSFNPVSAFSSFFDGWQMMGKPSHVEEPAGLPSFEGCYTSEFLSFIAIQSDSLKFRAGNIINSCRSIEGTYIDMLAKDEFNRDKKIWAIGPLNPGPVYHRNNLNTQHKCMDWLEKQSPKSVLYVSFGSVTSMTDEQNKELALGLEQSKHKFIWVLRDADKADIFEGDESRAQLPEGYEERVKEVGMVVRDWAPQVDILGHPSTGGFMSHCGWNSCLESITTGVPIAAWPMHSDQPKNACLVTDVLKVGLIVNRWENREELVTSSTIVKAIKRLMESNEGEEMRKRAQELGCATRQSVKEGGDSRVELDSFIAHVTR